jgi:CheY-like chemotaxis protein
VIASAHLLPERLFYLYGVVPEGQGLPSVDAVPLEAVTVGSLAAIVEQVPAAEFAPEVLEERMRSVEAMGPLARRHHTVLAAAMRGGPIVPARLFTLFSSLEAVQECLAAGATRFLATLARVTGCEEWGLRVLCDQEALAATIVASCPENTSAVPEGLSPGQVYLAEKRRKARAAQKAEERLDEILEEILDVLEACSTETRERPARSGDAPALSLALLVDENGSEAFRAAIDELAERHGAEGIAFEMSGPWPPYSFMDGDEEAGAATEPAKAAEPRDGLAPRSATVLIVDEQEQSRELLRGQLRAEGYRVVEAAGRREAVALAAEMHPDVTVLELGAGDGLATLRQLRQRGEGGAVVVLTANGTLQSARSALMLGAHDYMTRPYSVELLKSSLLEGLATHRRR